MMFEATKLYAFWGNRREGFDACAHRIDYVVMDLRPGHVEPGAGRAGPAAFRDRWFTVIEPRCAGGS